MTRRPAALAVPLLLGAVVALALGIYSSAHEPTGRDFVLVGFESAASWKSAFASVIAFLFVMQMSMGHRLTGRVGPRRPVAPWVADTHRLVGTVAFALSIPVVFHCIWVLGYRSDNSRVLAHSILGCVVYGLYVAKVLTVRKDDKPAWALPVVGSFLGFVMLATWWTSALVHYAKGGG